METSTAAYADDDWLLVVTGDHGMSDQGSHGGSSAAERQTGLVMLASGGRSGIDESVGSVDVLIFGARGSSLLGIRWLFVWGSPLHPSVCAIIDALLWCGKLKQLVNQFFELISPFVPFADKAERNLLYVGGN